MPDSKKDVKKLKEELKKLLEQDKKFQAELAKDDIQMAKMQADLDTMSPDPYKDVNENYEEFKKKYQYQEPPSPHVCEDPNAHYDEVAAKCICNTGYILDSVTGKCIESSGPGPTPEPTAEKDQYGVNKIYKDKEGGALILADKFTEQEFTRHYQSGKADENSYECEYKDSNKLENEEVTFYTQINGFKSKPDTISIKLLGNKHSDGSKDKWLIFQLATDGTSNKNFQIEDPHPDNTDNHQKTLFTIGQSLVGKAIGIKAITYIKDGKRFAETQVDFPVPNIDTPPNNWRKYIEITDVEKLSHGFLNATNGGALLRIDGTKKGDKPTTKFMSIREIVPELVGTGTLPPPPPLHVCPSGEYWDEAQQKCVKSDTNPEPTPTEGLVYDSNKEGGWNNGEARTVTEADGNISPDGKGLEMHASGNPTLIIDGKGAAVLQCQPGHGRAYVFCKNYNGILEEEIMFDANVENHTIQTRSRHQEGGAGPNRFGGLSAKVSPVDVGLKIERFHNEHLADTEKKLDTPLELGKWHKVKYTYNDTADGKGIFQKLEVNGKEVISQTTTTGIEPFFQDKASFDKNSYFWLRMNNTKAAKLGIRNVKLTLT